MSITRKPIKRGGNNCLSVVVSVGVIDDESINDFKLTRRDMKGVRFFVSYNWVRVETLELYLLHDIMLV